MNKVKKVLRKYRRLILLIILTIIVIISITSVFKFIKSLTPKNDLPETSSSFFLENDKGYHSLFNKDGKQLTDYIYINANDFYNEVSKVKDKESKYGIINENGKYVVKLGTYANIYQYGSLFKVEEDSKYSLLNNKGKKVIKKTDFEVIPFTGINSFITISCDNEYSIYNYNGKKIYSFSISKDENTSGPTANELGHYGSVYYNGLTIIFNIVNGKILTKIEENNHYCLDSANDDESLITLSTCQLTQEEEQNIQYKIIKNNKIKDFKEDCDKITLNNDTLICTKDNIRHLLNDKLKKVEFDVGDTSYQSYKTYAIKKGNNIEFINNNKKVSTLNDAILADKGYTKDAIYLTYKDDKYTYYNNKGKPLFEKSYKKATSFDKFGLAKVSDDENNYYFINTSGKKSSPEFTTANINGNYYIYTHDNLYGVLSKEGKVLVENKYTTISISKINDHYYAIGNKNDSEFELIDLDTKKTILKTDAPMILYDSYITVSKDDKTTYYTYKGKEFNK